MINAFRQIRLTNSLLTVTGNGVLQVGNEQVVYQSQTGQFYPINNPSGYIGSAQTGNFVSSTLLAATGSNLQSQLNIYTGKLQSFVTAISAGNENYFIQFPVNFISVPRVSVTLETTGNILYNTAIQNRTISGFNCLFSDIVTENVFLNTIATIN